MTTFPAFISALESNDHPTLLRLYESAMDQRNRAEDQVRCMLNLLHSQNMKGDQQPAAPSPSIKPAVSKPSTVIDHSISVEDLI
jgi:hypothetical protein